MKKSDRSKITTTNCSGRGATAAVTLLVLLITGPSLARADDLTGQSQDDPKDLLPSPATVTQPAYSASSTPFAPMPGWAHGITLGPLPDKLTPMGRGTKSAVAATTPASLAPPKDAPVSTAASASAASKPAGSDPTMMTISPFLQWIKSNPQAAAAEARQEAQTYHPAPPPDNAPAPASANATARNSQDDAYWLPPLIDSATFGSAAVTGSAAIYSRPQR